MPVQIIYTLPIMPHILQGVYKGLRQAMNTFVITPKRYESNSSIWRLVINQRMAFSMAALFASPSLLLPFHVPGYVQYVALWMLFWSLMTVLGVVLVPLTQWLRGLLTVTQTSGKAG